MRRSERQRMDEEFFDHVFSTAVEIVLAMNGEDGFPYAVPLNFVREGQVIYAHCAHEGTKMDLLRKDGRVAFCVTCDVQADSERHTCYYKSVCGTGRVREVTDAAERASAFAAIGRRYGSDCGSMPQAYLDKAAILRLDVASMSGKQNLPQLKQLSPKDM